MKVAKSILEERRASIGAGGGAAGANSAGPIRCGADSVSGAVSQRACVYCGARVVLNPVTDAFHLVHGPVGCASYTWDIRGSLSSGSDLFRHSFSTDLDERDVVFGGAAKLEAAIGEIMRLYAPPLIFVYSTCIVGVIGDDVEAVCRRAEARHGVRCVNVQAPGFAGNKSQGYRLAGDALMRVMRPGAGGPKADAVNILGDYNLAGEMWIIKSYLREIGIRVLAGLTGDSSYDSLMTAPRAKLNVVQCAGSMAGLAASMEDEFGIPFVRASFFGLEDTAAALRSVADLAGGPAERARAERLIAEGSARARSAVAPRLPRLKGRRAAVFVGGGFKAISLTRQFRELGMETVLVGTQTGTPEDYEVLASLVGEDTVILDDANPSELEAFMRERGADLLVGGVKERPLAYKLGVAFCDHNHERRLPLAGFVGAENFAAEIDRSMSSPVWAHARGPCPF
jgi:nitrogenase molybdenum-cofactor synthesis protein NifE